MSLDCRRKPEYLEETHTGTGRTRKKTAELKRNGSVVTTAASQQEDPKFEPVPKTSAWHLLAKNTHNDF